MAGRPASGRKLARCRREIGDAVDEDRDVAVEVPGQHDRRRPGRHLDLGDAGVHRIDREHQPTTEHVREVRHVSRDVPAWEVQVIEPFEQHLASLPAHRDATVAPRPVPALRISRSRGRIGR